MRKIVYLTLIAALALALPACTSIGDLVSGGQSLPGTGTTVRMGRGDWDTGWFQAEVFRALLQELGYTVQKPETLNPVAFYIFCAQGDLDFWANGWFPLHTAYLNFDSTAGKLRPVGFQVRQGALQGYLVDRATAEALEITNLGDLAVAETALVFDRDGDTKADLVGCNVGWRCEAVIEHHLDAFGLRDTVTHVQGEYSTLMAETIAQFQDGAPVLFYTWTPNWTVSDLAIGEDVVWLSVPFSALPDDAQADTAAGEIVGCRESPCNLGFGASDIRVVASVEFLAENPAAERLFEAVEIPLEDIAAQNVRLAGGQNSDEEIERHADEWIQANRELVDGWLSAARAAVE